MEVNAFLFVHGTIKVVNSLSVMKQVIEKLISPQKETFTGCKMDINSIDSVDERRRHQVEKSRMVNIDQ